MPGTDFLDTNVLVYAYQVSAPDKQRVAQDLIRTLAGTAVISLQVLTEFATTLLHKFEEPPSPKQLITILDRLSPIKLVTPDGDMVRRAVETRAAYGLHFYDCMIIAAAERAGCQRLLSEDFSAGQKYFGVTAVNPFR